MKVIANPTAPLWRRPFLWGAAAGLSVLAGLAFWALGGDGAAAPGLLGVALAALFGLIGIYLASRADRRLAGLLLAVAEESPEARLITDPGGAFVYANAAFHRLFAMAVSLDTIAAIVDGEEAGDEFARLRASAAAAVADKADLPLRLPSGEVEWRRISVLPLTAPRGYVRWRAEDITADRELGTVRRREEEMMADWLDNLPAGFFSSDSRGRILYANRTLGDWLGISAGDLSAQEMKFADFVVAEESLPVASGSRDNPQMHGEVTLSRTDGGTFRACLVQSEKVGAEGNMVYSRSILLRHLTWRDGGEAGGGSEQRLHWLFDEAPVGVVLLDLGGDVTDCNRSFLKLLGLHREAVIGRPFTERISKEDRGDAAAQLSKVVLGAVRATHLEVRMPGAGARELATSLYASRMEDAGGELSGLILHFIDTTEQKNLEVQFAQSQKMQAVGQLAGGVAHDFNNLLTAMIGFCDLLLERHDLADPSFSDIMQIKQNANRATNLVRQLLAFSRQQTLQPANLEPNDALSELSNLLGRLIGAKIELNMELDRDLGHVRVDRGQFDQVIINLAVNARDAMPGGGTLTIRTSNAAVGETVQRGHELMGDGDYVMVEIADTGNGIAKEDIGHIFEPFFSTKEVGEGTGLGLSTVYGIVHQTGGYIFVDSAPGEGTTFTVYLPCIRQEEPAAGEVAPAAAPARPPRPPARDGGEKDEKDLTGEGCVLLVEDEDAVRMFGGRALRNKGYKVLEADNGEAALDVINASGEAIDLIVSDVVMPGMDGHTLVQLVRHEVPSVKVILMSGYAEEVISEEIQRDPSIHFLAKPFSLKDLAGKVKEVMEG